jgi:chromosome segregation ATPase
MLTLAETAIKLGVSENTVRNWVKDGKIMAQTVLKGRREIYVIEEDEIDRYCAANGQQFEANDGPQSGSNSIPPALVFFQGEIDRREHRLAELGNENGGLREDKGILQGEVNQLRARLEEKDREIQLLREEIKDQQEIIAGLREQVASRDEALKEWKEGWASFQDQIQELRYEVSAVKDTKSAFKWPWQK